MRAVTSSVTISGVKAAKIEIIGSELAIRWEDGAEDFCTLESLRRHCPCAGCKGEMDVMGNVYKGPSVSLGASAFKLLRIAGIGGYAVTPVWADGHSTGIYSFEYLKRLCADAAKS